MPFPFAFLAPVIGAVVSGAAAAGTAVAAGAAAVGTAAAAAGTAVAAGAAAVGGTIAAGAAATAAAAAAAAAAMGTTGLVITGVVAASAVMVTVACITVREIKEKMREMARAIEREQHRKIVVGKIERCLEEGDYSTVNIGLYDDNDEIVSELVLKGEDIDSDIEEGDKIYLAA